MKTTIECDVLVIGGGGAAIRAAIAAKEKNPELTVALMTKGRLGHSGVTAIACSDRMAFHTTLAHTPPGGGDAWRHHAHDIYKLGGEVSDVDLAEILAKGSAQAFQYLYDIGVPWAMRDGLPDQFITDGSDYPRACYTGPKTSVHIEEALVKSIGNYDVKILDHAMALKLILNANGIAGVIACGTADNELYAVACPSVILATGGPGSAYLHNVYPSGMTGDGWKLACDVGAELVNVEFIQFMISSMKTKLLLSGSMMRCVPKIINETGEEILYKYLPKDTTPSYVHNLIFAKGYHFPVSYEDSTHIIDIAVAKECAAGHVVMVDFSQNPDHFAFENLNETFRARYQREMVQDLGSEKREQTPLNRLLEINPKAVDIFRERGIDIPSDHTIEVASAAQHFQGGVKIDRRGRTKVSGLWAAGEVAGGQHGANRPGGNALMDCQVFGRIAGEDAAQSKRPQGNKGDIQNAVENYARGFTSQGDREKLKRLFVDMATRLDRCGGVVRVEKNMRETIDVLERLEPDIDGACGMSVLRSGEELRNACFCALAILRAACMRKECRGPHLMFTDETATSLIPSNDEQWKKYIVISKDGMEVREPKRK